MDLVKIGKFIADCRKKNNLTQEQLAEKLYVTDRAVSKWERGLSLPDASKMLDLCSILEINVNELLMGEIIDMKDNEKKTNELLVELAIQEEHKNKTLMANMWVLLVSTTLFYIAVILISSIAFGEGFVFGTITVLSTLVFLCVAFYALKLEVDAGYYECKNCHHRFRPSYKEVLMAPHMSTTRHLRCQKCGKKTWAKKVLTKK